VGGRPCPKVLPFELQTSPVKVLAAATEKREREAHEKAERQKAAKEEAERLTAEKKKKKPIRYPTEDLDVRLSDKDKKGGVRVQRPIPKRDVLPFNDDQGTFESFLMVWNFLVVYG
jgi:bromodomain adjacent to zinc finger domain protein 1A